MVFSATRGCQPTHRILWKFRVNPEGSQGSALTWELQVVPQLPGYLWGGPAPHGGARQCHLLFPFLRSDDGGFQG